MALKYNYICAFILLTTVCCSLSQVVVGSMAKPDRDITNGLNKNGTNVCSYPETISIQVTVTYASQRVIIETYETTCGWWNAPCNQTRIAIKTVISTRPITKYFDRNVYHCCNGWTRVDNQQPECITPICNIKCQNGGKCVKPDTCECKKGYSGDYCQLDTDECKDAAKNNCEQVCINTAGGFKCSCRRGYSLNSDGRTCTEINECAAPTSPCGCAVNDGVCKSTCMNTQGSYLCKCNKGYQLNSAVQCKDINECFVNSKLCDHKCVNKPGAYECQCFKGYQHNTTTKKCEDIDECLPNNGKGDCSDTCTNIKGSYVCLCPQDKYLDGKTCKDIASGTKSEIFCQSGDIGMLTCKSHLEQISITNVFYGRISDKVCQTGNYTKNLQCIDPNAIQNLQACNGMASCLVMMDFWNDPCPGIEKYARVDYKCQIPPTK